MSFVNELLAAGVLCIIAWTYYSYKNWQNAYQKLKWMKTPPGTPLLGHVLLFPDSTAVLKVLQKFSQQYDGLFFLNFFFKINIMADDYKFMEFILSSNKIIEKSSSYNFLHNWLGTGLLTSTGEKWKQRRRIITPAFHFAILEQFVEVFDGAGKILIRKLAKEVDKNSVDIYPYITLCALDIICETAMGVSVNAQNHSDSEYVKSVKQMCNILIDRVFSVIQMHDFSYPLSPNYYREKRAVKILHDFTSSIIEKRRKETENKTVTSGTDEFGAKKKMAFLDLLLQANVNGKPLSNEDIREEVDTFMFEGHDTTTSGMSFTLFCIAGNQEVQNRIISEQKDMFGKDRDRPTTYQDLQQMKYLEMVIKEGLRLYPSVPMFGREANEDIEYEEGKIIPKGTLINIYPFGANRNPKYFPNPEKFDPSRFETINSKSPFAYVPFSAGPRNCIGQKFAMLEMKCTLSKILRNYELYPSIPEHVLILQSEAVLTSKNGVRVMLKKRKWD